MRRQVNGRTQPLLVQRTSHPGAQSRSTIRQAGLMNCNGPLIHLHIMLTVRCRVTLDVAPPWWLHLAGSVSTAAARRRWPHWHSLISQRRYRCVETHLQARKSQTFHLQCLLAQLETELQGTCRWARHESSSTVQLGSIYKRKAFAHASMLENVSGNAFVLSCCIPAVPLLPWLNLLSDARNCASGF